MPWMAPARIYAPGCGAFEFQVPEWSRNVAGLWLEYYDLFKARYPEWTQANFYLLGLASRPLIEAEFIAHGPGYYRDSVAIAIRNVWYQASVAEDRWKAMGNRIRKPVLDFGCGVGFFTRFMQQKLGPDGFYCLEVPGVQRDIVRDYVTNHGISWVDDLAQGPSQYGTVMASHVLEHIPNAKAILESLLAHTDNFIGGYDCHEGPGHGVVPPDDEAWILDKLREIAT